MNDEGINIQALQITPESLVRLIGLVEDGTINNTTAKDVLDEMLATGADPQAVVEDKGLAQISDTDALEALVDQIIADNPDEVQTYLAGKEGLLGWFVGQVMRETRGKANAQKVNKLFKEKLSALCE